MAYIEDTSPYLYLATAFFALSAVSSDLLFIRGSLTLGFLFLVLGALSGYSLDGSFSQDTLPFRDGDISITLLINAVLFGLNLFICGRLIGDEVFAKPASPEEHAMFRFFQSRCGLTPLEFQAIVQSGHYLSLDADTDVPNLPSTLYLVLEGKIECHTKQLESQDDWDLFYKRSGEFFDIKLFNIFTLPVGFDTFLFKAKTTTRCKLFGWTVDGLVAMRDATSPAVQPYWDLMVMRSLTNSAVRHHLKGLQDTLYDSGQIPEDPAWLEGAPSRDFGRSEKPVGNLQHLRRQLQLMGASLWQMIPPHGIRHRPGIHRSPKQEYQELVSKAHTADHFRFIPKRDVNDV